VKAIKGSVPSVWEGKSIIFAKKFRPFGLKPTLKLAVSETQVHINLIEWEQPRLRLYYLKRNFQLEQNNLKS
jgi:hypothetical protein